MAPGATDLEWPYRLSRPSRRGLGKHLLLHAKTPETGVRVVVVNYKQQQVVPLFFFMAFVLVCLIGLPIWTAVRFGAVQGPYAGKLLVAPIFGLFWLFLIARTLSFNARVRRDPRALQWDALGLNLWQDGRAERLQWPQVGQVSILQGRRPTYPSFLKIATKGA